MTTDELMELNLSPQEAKLYQAALELSPAHASDLAEKAGIERTASYPHLKNLVQKGLLKESPAKGVFLFSAENPKRLGEMIDEKKRTYQELLPELLSIFNQEGIKPKIKYYEGREGAKLILTHSLEGNVKEILHLTPAQNIIALLGERFASQHINSRVQKGIKMRVLRPKETLEGPWEMIATDKSLLREIRYLSSDFKLDDQITIYLNTVAIISSAKENYGLEIESKEFADTMRSFFELAWEAAQKYQK